MSKEVVEWLRDHARRCEQSAIAEKWRLPDDRSPRSFEAEYASKFADEIEQRFVLDSVAKLTSKPSSFPPTHIRPVSALDLRRRRRSQQK